MLTYDGVTTYTYGTAAELARYPPDVTRLGSIVVLGQFTYFSGTPSTSSQESVCRCGLETGEVKPAFRNTEQNADVTRITEFAGTIVFSDRTAYWVKTYDPVDNTVSVLLGSGCEGQLDGTQQSCTFIQIQGICLVEP